MISLFPSRSSFFDRLVGIEVEVDDFRRFGRLRGFLIREIFRLRRRTDSNILSRKGDDILLYAVLVDLKILSFQILDKLALTTPRGCIHNYHGGFY
jgi:hypothetical protein